MTNQMHQGQLDIQENGRLTKTKGLVFKNDGKNNTTELHSNKKAKEI